MGVVNGSDGDIFWINDINLRIPPTDISVRKEDLTYQWKTLRTNIATKIPSGHGRTAIGLNIVFTGDLLLTMHRLIVQLKNNPFCYVDNRYLRQMIVPEWPNAQNMALTMTSLTVKPMPDSSDSWLMELDLTWFNYLPFTPNYIFREEWNTEWVDMPGGGAAKYSIGWDYDPVTDKRTPSKSIVAKRDETANARPRWDVVVEDYSKKKNRSIHDMEVLHEGQIFDLLPMPGNMEPARFVFMPKHSNIYKRYCNLLQRDALLKHFDIDVVNDLRLFGGQELVDRFFAVDASEGLPYTGILSEEAPSELLSKWLDKMTSFHGQVTFVYDGYKDIRLPQKLTNAMHRSARNILSDAIASDILVGGEKQVQVVNSEGQVTKTVTVRDGYSKPHGKHVPVRASIEEFTSVINDRVRARTAQELKRYYGESKEGRMHNGLDVGVRDMVSGLHQELPVYAVEDGEVVRVGRLDGWVKHRWKMIDKRITVENEKGESKYVKSPVKEKEHRDDLLNSLERAGFIDSRGVQKRPFGDGTVIRSIRDINIIYFQDRNDGGNHIYLQHFDCSATTPSISKYMHLSRFAPGITRGTRVKAGDIIGYTGGSGPYDPDYIVWAYHNLRDIVERSWHTQGSARVVQIEETPPSEAYTLAPHLHFEYQEPKILDGEGGGNPAGSTSYAKADGSTHVLVDPLVSYQKSYDQAGQTIDLPSYEEVNEEATAQQLEEMVNEEGLEESEANELLASLAALMHHGWKYYEDDPNVKNIWYKRVAHTIRNGSGGVLERLLEGTLDESLQETFFIEDDMILVNAMGSLRHVVANIPVLSHEFPTQQYLGSVEPSYLLEFAVLDDNRTINLDGIGRNAEYVQAMRSRLSKNARDFRVITDAWCLATDTFITRLLGTTSSHDYVPEDYDTNEPDRLYKRTLIARDHGATVPGNPGLSMMVLELEETNPYQDDKVVSTAPKITDIEEARGKILRALVGPDLADLEYKELVLLGLIGELAGADKGAREIELNDWTFSKRRGALGVVDSGVAGEDGLVLIKDPHGSYYNMLTQLGLGHMIYGYGRSGDSEPAYMSISLNDLREALGQNIIESRLLDDLEAPGLHVLEERERHKRYYTSYSLNLEALADTSLPQKAVRSMRSIIRYHRYLHRVLDSAELMFAEEELGGFGRSYLSEQLYGLEIRNNQWQAFQHYFDEYTRLSSHWMTVNYVRSIEGRLQMGDPLRYPLSENARLAAEAAAYSWYNQPTAWIPTNLINNATSELFGLIGAAISPVRTINTVNENQTSRIRQQFADSFVRSMPLAIAAGDYIEKHFEGIVGDLLGGERPKAFMGLSTSYKKYLDASNLMHHTPGTAASSYIMTPGTRLQRRGNEWVENKVTSQLSNLGLLYNIGTGGTGMVLTMTDNSANTDWARMELGEVGAPPEYPVDRQNEVTKIQYFKKILATLADQIRNAPRTLELLGLQELAYIDTSNSYVGQECYPDMVLPYHPYYDTLYEVSPDFYMWNLYEDGQAFHKDLQEEVSKKVGEVVRNSHESLKGFEAGKVYNPGGDPLVSETNVDDATTVLHRMTPEGSDQVKSREKDGVEVDRGPMGTPFANSADAKEAEDRFYQGWEFGSNVAEQVREHRPPKVGGTLVDGFLEKTGVQSNARAMSFGLTDGSELYPIRVNPATYQDLWDRLDQAEELFGSRSGHLGEEITDENIRGLRSRLNDTAAAAMAEYTHGFSPDFLHKLALDSSKDMISQKMSMRRAYPAFKLYFVEEDTQNNRFLNFDNFNSYNGVKEFSVVQSKKMAADFATIVLQNVSGTLDGTARGVVADLDYYSRSRATKISKENPGISETAGEPVQLGTDMDRPFGAVVLRPGLNVQLRCGYSNDPNALEVMVSGRVVDISWNQGGDLVEIHVQGFGAELEQVVKGSHPTLAGSERYATTHQLLGSMMLSPELKHFGRWSWGQLTQVDEDKDSTLDFFEYSREGLSGRWSATAGITKWMANHPYWVALGALGFSVIGLLPPSRGVSFLSRVPVLRMLKVGSKSKIPRIGTARVKNLDKALGMLSLTIQNSDNAAKMAARNRKATGAIIARYLGTAYDDIGKALSVEAAQSAAAGSARTATHQIMRNLKPAIDAFAKEGNKAALIKAINKQTRIANLKIFAGQWLGLKTFSPVSISWVGQLASGQAGSTFVMNMLLGSTGGALTGLAGGLTLDLINQHVARPFYDATMGNLRKAFLRTKSRLFLSPQDDNLYPPSPKDYMLFSSPSYIKSAANWIATFGGRAFLGTDEFGNVTNRLINPNVVIEKRLLPKQCVYIPIYSTIWDIFHEMTLRHPGWVYGARPYGKDFRYTMFFGVPSQRYWAKGAPNRFIDRMNLLKGYLEDGKISESDYRQLYGDTVEDGRTLEEWKEDLLRKLTEHDDILNRYNESPIDGYGESEDTDYGFAVAVEQTLTARALKEYLRGLELRFVPFRRYHLMTSQRDIVWNGIISSESNVVNAVDVTYFEEDWDSGPNSTAASLPKGTEVIKASSAIPEHMIKLRPISYPNCRGYTMALRYGMGELIHSMKEMYRGEVILLGNSRIRPWDIGILVDTYNDIVGPIEIDQVVTNFSHETGYITEIKPAAVVIGNEISSWPMIEAMKLFSMAVQDTERKYGGIGANSGFIGEILKGIDRAQKEIGAAKNIANDLLDKSGINTAREALNMDPLEFQSNRNFETFMQGKYDKLFPAGVDIVRDGLGGIEIPEGTAPEILYQDALGLVGGGAALGLTGAAAMFSMASVAALKEGGLVSWKGAAGLAFGVGAGAAIGTAAGLSYMNSYGAPSLAFLIGAPVIISKMLREDSVMVIPLVKNGLPIVSGLSYQDPSTFWKSFGGKIKNYTSDAISGVRDAADTFQQYGTEAWYRLGEPGIGDVVSSMLSGRGLGEDED